MRTCPDTFAPVKHFPEQILPAHPLHGTVSEFSGCQSPFIVRKQNAGTAFANTFKYLHRAPKIPNMKHWQFQFYVTKMTCTFCQHLTTCLTGGSFAAYTQPWIKHPILLRPPFWHLHISGKILFNFQVFD